MNSNLTAQLERLRNEPPWDWPENAKDVVLRVLRDESASESERLLAAELAAENPNRDDETAEALLAVVQNESAPNELRGQAAIGLGPLLEEGDEEVFGNVDDRALTEETFQVVVESLRLLYADARLPKEVRRRVLEGAVRAPRDWQKEAVREAYASDDEDWKLTGVFCMKYVRGFDEQILESLTSPNPDIALVACSAAGEWGVAGAWPHIRSLLRSERTSRPLFIQAMHAAATVCPDEAASILADLCDSTDEEIAENALEALAMAEGDPEDGEEAGCALCSDFDEDE